MGCAFAWCCGDQWRGCANEGSAAGRGLSIWPYTGGLDVSEHKAERGLSLFVFMQSIRIFNAFHISFAFYLQQEQFVKWCCILLLPRLCKHVPIPHPSTQIDWLYMVIYIYLPDSHEVHSSRPGGNSCSSAANRVQFPDDCCTSRASHGRWHWWPPLRPTPCECSLANALNDHVACLGSDRCGGGHVFETQFTSLRRAAGVKTGH